MPPSAINRRIPCKNEYRDARNAIKAISKQVRRFDGFPNLKCSINIEIQVVDRWNGNTIQQYKTGNFLEKILKY